MRAAQPAAAKATPSSKGRNDLGRIGMLPPAPERREAPTLSYAPACEKARGGSMTASASLVDARALLDAADRLLGRVLERAREITAGGSRIDDHQVLVEAVAYAATEGRAARALVDFAA